MFLKCERKERRIQMRPWSNCISYFKPCVQARVFSKHNLTRSYLGHRSSYLRHNTIRDTASVRIRECSKMGGSPLRDSQVVYSASTKTSIPSRACQFVTFINSWTFVIHPASSRPPPYLHNICSFGIYPIDHLSSPPMLSYLSLSTFI